MSPYAPPYTALTPLYPVYAHRLDPRKPSLCMSLMCFIMTGSNKYACKTYEEFNNLLVMGRRHIFDKIESKSQT